MYIIVYEYDLITPGLMDAPDLETALLKFDIAAKNEPRRVTLFKKRDSGLGFDEIKTVCKNERSVAFSN